MAKQNFAEVDETLTPESVLDMGRRHVKRPKLVPEGPWTIRCMGHTIQDGTNLDGTEQTIINLRYTAFEPGPEVDPDAVEEGGYEAKTLWRKVYITKEPQVAAYDGTLENFYRLAAMHGLDDEFLDEAPVVETAKALRGRNINAMVGTRSYTNKITDEQVTDNTITQFSRIEE
jgi:hypothetical protein